MGNGSPWVEELEDFKEEYLHQVEGESKDGRKQYLLKYLNLRGLTLNIQNRSLIGQSFGRAWTTTSFSSTCLKKIRFRNIQPKMKSRISDTPTARADHIVVSCLALSHVTAYSLGSHRWTNTTMMSKHRMSKDDIACGKSSSNSLWHEHFAPHAKYLRLYIFVLVLQKVAAQYNRLAIADRDGEFRNVERVGPCFPCFAPVIIDDLTVFLSTCLVLPNKT